MADQFQEANLFELTGGGIQVTYSTSSFSGVPLFSYRDASANQQFSGDEIDVIETTIGNLVTVTLQTIPDLRVVRFTLVLPPVNVIFGSAGTCIDLPAITSTTHTTIAGPNLGPTVTYTPAAMSGTAQVVAF